MKTTGLYPHAHVDAAGAGVVSSAGGLLLTEAVRASGLDTALLQALAPWRKPFAIHDPGKIVCDLAVASPWAGTAWPTSPSCAPSPACTELLRRTRRCPG